MIYVNKYWLKKNQENVKMDEASFSISQPRPHENLTYSQTTWTPYESRPISEELEQ